MKRDLHLASPNIHGDDVTYAQRLLKNSRFDLDVHVGEEGIYDKPTALAVKRTKYLLGYPNSAINEVFGDALELFLRNQDPSRKLPLAYRVRRGNRLKAEKEAANVGFQALKWAKSYIGHNEYPTGSNNCSPFTQWYGTSGVPWCAEFVSYCLNRAGFKHVDPRAQRWAYVPYIVNDARAHRNGLLAVSAAQVRPGDLVCYDWDGGVADHIGFFEGWVPSSAFSHAEFTAIEGNTSITNNSNGGEVQRRTRYTSQVEQFVRCVSS